MVRVTRDKVLDRFAREAFAARRDALVPSDFAPLAYQAACDEGLDDVTGGPAGQFGVPGRPECDRSGYPGYPGYPFNRARATKPDRALRSRLGGRARRDQGDDDALSVASPTVLNDRVSHPAGQPRPALPHDPCHRSRRVPDRRATVKPRPAHSADMRMLILVTATMTGGPSGPLTLGDR